MMQQPGGTALFIVLAAISVGNNNTVVTQFIAES